LSAGSHTVALTGLASNCAVSGQNPRSTNVPAGGVGHADFAINCTALPPPQNHPPVVNAGSGGTILIGSFTLNASFPDQDHDVPFTTSTNLHQPPQPVGLGAGGAVWHRSCVTSGWESP